MEVPRQVKDKILETLHLHVKEGCTITALESVVTCERHTLSKYLTALAAQGLVYYRPVGKAKIWYLNLNPLAKALDPQKEKTKAEHMLSQVISSLSFGIVVMDATHTVQFANSVINSWFGDIKGKRLHEVLHTSLFDLTKSHTFELVDPAMRDFLIHILPSVNSDGKPISLVVFEEVTGLRSLEKENRAFTRLLNAERIALNNAAIVAETDLQGVITFVNDKFVEISGYSKEELIGKTHKVVNSSFHSRAFFQDMWTTISKGKVWRGIFRNRKKDGTFYWVDSVISPVFGDDGKPIKYLSIRFDVTSYYTHQTKLPGF